MDPLKEDVEVAPRDPLETWGPSWDPKEEETDPLDPEPEAVLLRVPREPDADPPTPEPVVAPDAESVGPRIVLEKLPDPREEPALPLTPDEEEEEEEEDEEAWELKDDD